VAPAAGRALAAGRAPEPVVAQVLAVVAALLALAQAVRVPPVAVAPVPGLVAAQVRALADPAAAREPPVRVPQALVLPGELRVDPVPQALAAEPRLEATVEAEGRLAAEPPRRDRRLVRRDHRPP
jgi:hypothetical protein